MPCAPNTPGCIQRKSGQWYERVVFDDGFTIPSGIWTQFDSNIWQADPGYLEYKYGQNPPPAPSGGFFIGTNSNFVAFGPRMMLQDGEPLLWEDPWPDYNPLTDPYDPNPVVDPAAVLTGPGMRTYDQESGILYVWPFYNKDPNTVKMESWKGTTPDVRFRHMFDGNMEYVEIKGIEFRLFLNLLPGITSTAGNFNYLKFEDNVFSYGWTHLFSDLSALTLQQRSDMPRNNWQVRYNVFYRPSREVFQIWGNDHIFEFNEIIEHIGPWAGGAAMVSAINVRHMNNAQIRFNYINHLGNKWHPGSSIMFEMDTEQQDVNGDCIYAGTIIEYNFIGDMNGGIGIFLGRGGCRMRDITIRNNVFGINRGVGVRYNIGTAIAINSPQENLQIYNNVFYDQKSVFTVRDDRGGMKLEDLPNTISIRDNIFANNNRSDKDVIPSRLSTLPGVTIDNNLYYNNSGSPVGTNVVIGDPLFTDLEDFNFTLQQESPAIQPGPDLGAYEFGEPVLPGTKWWICRHWRSSFY